MIKETLAFLDGLHVPKTKSNDYCRLLVTLSNHRIRTPTAQDVEQKRKVKLLLIQTKGKGRLETFEGFAIQDANLTSIGDRYANGCVYDSEGNGKPVRIALKSPRKTIIEF